MNTKETNTNTNTANTMPDAWDAINPDTHGGITADAVKTAEGIENAPAAVPRVKNGEMITERRCSLSGWSALFKALAAYSTAPKWFCDNDGHPLRFAFRAGDMQARRAAGDKETDPGYMTVVNYVPTVKYSGETGKWFTVSSVLDKHGIAVPSAVNLKTAKKIQSAFNRIFCSGHSPAEVFGKKLSSTEKDARIAELEETIRQLTAKA